MHPPLLLSWRVGVAEHNLLDLSEKTSADLVVQHLEPCTAHVSGWAPVPKNSLYLFDIDQQLSNEASELPSLEVPQLILQMV
jgi:hypothetical protein